jgi:hypothetical protein
VRKEREEILLQIKNRKKTTKTTRIVTKDREEPVAQAPPVQVPPVHPMYGPAVYDYQAN